MLRAHLDGTEYFSLQYGFIFSSVFDGELLTLVLQITEEHERVLWHVLFQTLPS